MADQPHIIDDGFSEPEQVRKIFVGNLPYEADEGTGVLKGNISSERGLPAKVALKQVFERATRALVGIADIGKESKKQLVLGYDSKQRTKKVVCRFFCSSQNFKKQFHGSFI